jgi:hypothetical protein
MANLVNEFEDIWPWNFLAAIFEQNQIIISNQEKIMSQSSEISNDVTEIVSFVTTLAPILPQILTALQNGSPVDPAVLAQLDAVAAQAGSAQQSAQSVATAVGTPPVAPPAS